MLSCAVGILIIGWTASGSFVQGIMSLFNALIAAGKEFWPTITVISLVVAMSGVLKDVITSYSIHYTKLYEKSDTERV